MTNPSTLTSIFLRLREHGLRYWIWVAVIILVSATGSGYVYEYLDLIDARSRLFQLLLDLGPRPPEPKYVKTVLIEDDEYWLGDPAGRRPIKRDYLGRLVGNLVDAGAYVIALDFDLRTPDPTSTQIPKDYEKETRDLIESIVMAAAKGRRIVLATPIIYDRKGQYWRDADPYQAYGLCKTDSERVLSAEQIGPVLVQAIKDNRKNITCGYIHLPDDPLVIPSRLKLADNAELDSFALAIAKAGWPDMASVQGFGSNIRYGNFISEAKLRDPKVAALLSAAAVMGKGKKEDVDAVKAALSIRPTAVIVGANWSTYAINRGPAADLHQTPVGPIVGALLHANFVEAILDSRIYGFVSERMLHATEIAFSIIAAVALALAATLGGKILYFLACCLFLLIIQWIALHGFAVFFDASVPLLGLGLHSILERLFGVHQESGRHISEKLRT
jgi:hypothetical protein